MHENVSKHVLKLSLESIEEPVVAEPQVPCSEEEVKEVLYDLYFAVDNKSYIQAIPTVENPALSDDYIFTIEDEHGVLKDLAVENFVGKIEDLSKGARRRKVQGFPQEFLYVFKYPCKLMQKKMGVILDEPIFENVLIYIKINDRKIPVEKVFVISFHKNNPK